MDAEFLPSPTAELPLSLSHFVTRYRSPSPELVRAAPRHPQQRHVPVVEPLLALCPARHRKARCLTVHIRGASPKFAPHRPNVSPKLRRSPSTRPRSTPATVPTSFVDRPPSVEPHRNPRPTLSLVRTVTESLHSTQGRRQPRNIYFLNHVLNLL
jgi:hypothetical protein